MKTIHKKNRKGKRAKFKGIKHGVKKITDGFRITLPIWYTMNKDVCQF